LRIICDNWETNLPKRQIQIMHALASQTQAL